jgi:hypothetical protein
MRSYSAQSLIALPTLSASQAVALATQLETHAKGHKLSAEAEDALSDVSAARRELEKVNIAKVAAQKPTTNPEAVAADRVLDRAWGAAAELVSAWVRIDDKKLSPLAKELEETLFAAGMGFLAARYEEEWAESASRLKIIEQEKLDGHFEKLGGAVFLATLKRAHSAYGKALGVTEVKEAPAAATPNVKQALDDVAAALREYVAKVSAMASKKKKGSTETVDALLSPLTAWRSTRSAPVDAPVEPAPAPQGVPATTPS